MNRLNQYLIGVFLELPKDKLNERETNRKRAFREVKEEVGLDSKIKSSLPNTYHCYYDNDVFSDQRDGLV